MYFVAICYTYVRILFNKETGHYDLPLTISTDDGRKGPEDKIIKYNGLPISMNEIAKLLLMLWENEDKLYPPPKFRGAKMSLDFINELFEKRELSEELLRKYKLL